MRWKDRDFWLRLELVVAAAVVVILLVATVVSRLVKERGATVEGEAGGAYVLSSVQPCTKPVELKATPRKYPDGERDGETSLKRERHGPHKHCNAQSGNQPSGHDTTSCDRLDTGDPASGLILDL